MLHETIGHYRILRKLGSGGLGVVYEAEDSKRGRRVALKLLSESSRRDPQARERFLREARAAGALNHPGICTMHASLSRGQPARWCSTRSCITLRRLPWRAIPRSLGSSSASSTRRSKKTVTCGTRSPRNSVRICSACSARPLLDARLPRPPESRHPSRHRP
jgi:Protein kinase domain